MTQLLFRDEVIRAKRTSWLGGISLAQPLRSWVLTGFAGLTAAIVILFLVCATYTRRSRVVGQLVPVQGMATVLAPATGVISRVHIPEGGRVEAGQPIAVVTVPRATVTGDDTIAALQQRLRRRADGLVSSQTAQQALLDAQELGLNRQLETAERELAQIESEIATRQQQVRLATDALQKLHSLLEDRYVSDLQVKQQEAAALTHVSEVQSLQRQAVSTRRLIAQLQQAVHQLPAQRQTNEANFTRDLAVLEQEQLELQTRGGLAIVAPVSGVVATLLKQGQAVQGGQPLVSVLPGDGKLEAELLVPSRAIGFIEHGDVVLLRYQAFPHQKFGHHRGRVARVSRSTVDTITSTGAEPMYRVNVELEHQAVIAFGRREALKPGMVLDADILGEKRTLVEWVMEPLYSVQGTIFDP